MGLPILYEFDDLMGSGAALDKLVKKHFVGSDKKILDIFLKEFECKTVSELLEKAFSHLAQEIDLGSLNLTNIEQINVMDLAASMAKGMNYSGKLNIDEKELLQFKDTAVEFIKNLFHNIAFPVLAIENPNAAVSAKNMLTRTISAAVASDETLSRESIEDALDIDNLPTAPSLELLKKFGVKFSGLDSGEFLGIAGIPDSQKTVIMCELSAEQSVYLCCVLEQDHDALKNWQKFLGLLKPCGSAYDNAKVQEKKIGLVIAVIQELHKRKTLTNRRYLSQNKGNGITTFFQSFLINVETGVPFPQQLRKYPTKKDRALAEIIVDEVLSPDKHKEIVKRAHEMYKEVKK